MRLLSSGFFAILLISPVFSHPVTFEQRSPSLFEARVRGGRAMFRPEGVSLGPVTLRFPGASPKSRWEGVGEASPSTYISRNVTKKFLQYPKLTRRELYPGIDAIFYGNGDGEDLEYDLSLAPGASPNRVRLAFDGARELRIDAQGNLMVETASGVLEQKVPRVFQSNGRQVTARYVLLSRGEAGIRLGSYDLHSKLTIDPELVYTNYFGGTGSDAAKAIVTDAQGNLYIQGLSNSVDFPNASGSTAGVDAPLFALTNSGKTVTPVSVAQEDNVLAIGGTPDGKILYAVTAAGTFVSADSGTDWYAVSPLPAPLGSIGTAPAVIGNISVDAQDIFSAMVATNRGLYGTHTSGQQWFSANYGLPNAGDGTVYVTQVIIDPLDHTQCYAITGRPYGLFKSTDICNTWKPLNPTYAGEPAVPQIPYSGLVMALAPNGNDLYVVDGNAVLLKSIDGGATWKNLAQQLYGSKIITIDPNNTSNIYVLDSVGVQKSTDGGATFKTIVPTQIPGNTQGNNVQAFAFDPASGTVYAGTLTSVYATADGGATLQAVPQLTNFTLNSLTAIGGRVYAAVDAPMRPFVMKLDPTGSKILYSTFLGGSQADTVSGFQVDSQGNAFLAGTTYAIPDFPVGTQLSPASPVNFNSGFVLKLSPDGTKLLYSSALGASKGLNIGALALDAAGSAYITGQTASPDFPATKNAIQPVFPALTCTRPQDAPFIYANLGANAFVSKLSADGSALVYSTFLGGSCGSVGLSLVVDPAGEAIVGGDTTSPEFPVTANTYQTVFPPQVSGSFLPNPLYLGFVSQLSAAGDKLIASSFIGGGFGTQASALTLDASGNLYVAGNTNGIAPGATPGAYQSTITDFCTPTFGIGPSPPPTPHGDAFLLKLDPTLSTARLLTYLGGGCYDSANAVALDPSGNVWLMGLAGSSDFPLKAPFEFGPGGTFISEFDKTGSQLLFSSHTDATALAIDPTGAVWLAGAGTSPTLPKRIQTTYSPGFASGYVGTSVLLNKIDPATNPPVEIDGISAVTGYPPAFPAPYVTAIAPGQLIQITGHNLGPSTKANAQLDASGRLQDIVAGVIVQFDDIPAPLISVQDGTIECFAPFEITQATKVTVTNNGQASNAVSMPVSISSPQILSVMNADGTPNSKTQPAKVGSVIVVYVSGLGLTTPLSVDGLVTSFPLPVPVNPVNVYFPGSPGGPPQFAGAAPGLIAGITQVNVLIPPGTMLASFSVGVNSASAPLYVVP